MCKSNVCFCLGLSGAVINKLNNLYTEGDSIFAEVIREPEYECM